MSPNPPLPEGEERDIHLPILTAQVKCRLTSDLRFLHVSKSAIFLSLVHNLSKELFHNLSKES